MIRYDETSELDIIYTVHCNYPEGPAWSIFLHLPFLRAISTDVGTILELGVSDPVSTWAFLRGMKDSKTPTRLISCDIVRKDEIDKVERVANEENLDFVFYHGNDLVLDFPPADLVFIDTWHVYGQLKRELDKFGALSRKWIVLHDTEIDKIHGESVRMKHDIDAMMTGSGYTREEITTGLWPAIDDFLEENPDWRLSGHYGMCCGLTVLERF